MRLRRSRLEEFFHKKMTVKKDKEGSTSEEYGTAVLLPERAGRHPEKYRLSSTARDCIISGISGYREAIRSRRMKKAGCIISWKTGTDIEERDGICLYVAADQLQTIGSYPSNHIVALPWRWKRYECKWI